MTERSPTSSSASAETPAWDLPAVADVLGTPAEPHHDPIHGAGVAFRIGAVQPLALELFPSADIVRLTGGNVQLSLLHQAQGPRLAPEGLVFELPSNPAGRFLSVSPAGEVTLLLVPDATGDPVLDDPTTPRLGPQDAPSVPVPASTVPTVEIAPPIAPGAAESPSEPAVPPPPVAATPPERDYVPRLTGRLARNPRFHTTKQGVLVAEFDLGVKDQDDPATTTWFAIAVFGGRAEQLRDTIKQGDLVDVIGSYRHVREFTGKDGRKRQKEQYYATVITRR